MPRRHRVFVFSPALAAGCMLAAVACDPGDGDEGVESQESGYTTIAEGSPEALGVLRVANEASPQELRGPAGIASHIADNIVAVRLGDDGASGTPDDVVFTTLAELDRVPFVTASTIDALLLYAKSRGLVVRPGTSGGAPGTWTVVPPQAGWPRGSRWTDAAVWVDGSGVLRVASSAARYEPKADLVFPTPLPASWSGALYQPVLGTGPTGALALAYNYRSSGYPSGGIASAAAWDRTTRTWSAVTTDGLELRRTAAVVWAGDRWVAILGSPAGNGTIRAQTWKPGEAAWTTAAKLTHPAVGRVNGVYWTGSEVLVWGAGAPLHFDPVASTWRVGPAPARAFVPLGYGAAWDGARLVSVMDRAAYDPVTGTWAPISAIGAPPDCAGSVVAKVGGKIVVWGGSARNVAFGSSGGTGYREVLCSYPGAVYDLTKDTWTAMAPAPYAIRTGSLFATDGTMLWVGGGRDGVTSASSTSLGVTSGSDMIYVP